MKREDKQMILIYALILIVIVLVVILAKVVKQSVPKENQKKTNNGTAQKVDINPYPAVNDECTFDIDYAGYNNLTMSGCQGGYTRYNINNIILDEKKLDVTIIYSDKEQPKTGLYINNRRALNTIDNVAKIKFGIFENKLFIYDTTNNEANALAFNSKGNEVYNLKTVLEKKKIKDLSTGETNISSKTLDPNSFTFQEGFIEFNSASNTCEKGETSKGSRYKVTYKNEEFSDPEFMQLISCS